MKQGIAETAAWRDLDDGAVATLRAAVGDRIDDLLKRKNPVEAETENKLVYPVLRLLGWDHISVQQRMDARGRKDVPDALLFPDADADAAAAGLDPWQRFRHGAALVEAKRWNRPLDRAAQGDQGVPAAQLMHYLSRADVTTQGKMRWGILTNGRQWRLYWQGALSVADDYLEIDLGKMFDLPDCGRDLLDAEFDPDHVFRLFLLLFGRAAFLPAEQGRSFHDQALIDARQWEERVARDLSDVVFDRVFPLLVQALPLHDRDRPGTIDDAYLEQVRSNALVLLYRLLFILYAEDRNLLPDERGPYARYSLTRMRLEIADAREAGTTPAARSTQYWSRLETIFGAIAEGDDALGIPPYNGGLFDPANALLLARVRLSDSVTAEVIFLLSHRSAEPRPRYINYRDLSVQQLGSIYESILEYAVEADDAGGVRPRPDNSARHRSGSYYTPEDLVGLIIERAVGPLVAECIDTFAAAVTAGTTGVALAALDPATRMLELKIVDPAMGSGHFLVSLVDWLSDKVFKATEDAASVAGGGYASPLVARIAALRADILSRAEQHGWPIVADQLDDPHIVRRMVLKRCIYGVDLNPMAVELAKVALWLHSFTVGAPLSFLDHHLRCGNSVLGAWVRPTTLWLANRGSLMVNRHLASIDNVAAAMEEIETIPDNDIAEVEQSKALFGTVAEASAPIDALFHLIEADTLMGVFRDAPARIRESAEQIERVGRATVAQMAEGNDAQRAVKAKALAKVEKALAKAAEAERRYDRAEAFKMVLEGSFGDPAQIATGTLDIADTALREGSIAPSSQTSLLPSARPDDRRRLIADTLVREARGLADAHRFFNWEIAFPGVWRNLASQGRSGGFDAVIGNPPYVRQEMIGAIKPALESSYDSYAGTADLYVYFYEQGLKLLRPGGRMAYVVTNKWLKAGYAVGLRRLFAEGAWVEFMADFGHARRFFPDADVFPCVTAVRKPDAGPAPETFDLAVIPRDDVPRSGLAAAVQAASYIARRDTLTPEPWTLEPPDVAALLAKIRANGVPLVEYAGVKPLYGVKTGFNEAFLIDTPTKERLIADDGRAVEIIKPYLRGQDIDRWLPDWQGLWMIVMKSSSDFAWPWAGAATETAAEAIFAETFPSLHRHFKRYESLPDPKTGKPKGLRHREDHGRFWWELRPCAYYDAFEREKIVFTEITWTASFARDRANRYLNNTAYILTSSDVRLIANLNSPAAWWFGWRDAIHGKDEALRFMASFIERFPLAQLSSSDDGQMIDRTEGVIAATTAIRAADHALADWLRHEIGFAKLPAGLAQASRLDSDGFIAAVRAALPKRAGITPSRLMQLRAAFADTAEPARAARVAALADERALSDIVNRAYGLTPHDVTLMWRTAPPRMPLAPPVVAAAPLTDTATDLG
ncbi:Eco57I restriction-modification methylase domain-containing protein [uncultured Sphingomonas sp.]|uniref:Eco57I restriction-modification methylase domain-containing protein n=1 Tax=uncultured Sphingomonas sp. TaxID=158754 RepID=UPI0035CBD1A5